MLRTLLILWVICVARSVPIVDRLDPRAEKCGYESCTDAEPGLLNVHIVAHTHDDVGWLKTVDQYYYGSNNTIQKAGVQYILDSVIKELWADRKRKFIYVETAFLWKWWVRQSEETQHKVQVLVRTGQLQFVGGAWSMNDEAASHYQSTIDQFTWGLSKLNQTFGHCGLPRVGWQIDPFGHAREFASLLAAMGYDGLFLGRIDYQDKGSRLNKSNMEMVWRGDDDLGSPSDIFTGVNYNTYSPPSGFCFDVLCDDEPIVDDPDSPLFNVDERISSFLKVVTKQAASYRTNNILITMGGDFTYQDAHMWYHNLDKLIEYTNLKAAKDGLNIKLFYSTPTCYLKAVKDANPTLPTKQDDFFPYASDPTAYWTGYFTSRPTTKYFEREGNNYLQAMKQLQVLTNLEEHNMFVLNELKSAMGIMQHHDAVTGTEKEHVTHDYERILNEAIEDSLIIAKQAFNKQVQGDALKPPILSFDRCHFNESRCYTSENANQFVVTVYNPLAWTLDATPVRLPVLSGDYAVVACNGEEISSQLVELPMEVTKIPTRNSQATHEVVFLAYNVPGMGYKTFYVKKKNSKAKRDAKTNDDKHNYYINVNDYWDNIKEKTLIDIKNIEENEANKPMLIFTKSKPRIPDEPVITGDQLVFLKGSYVNRKDFNVDLNKDILKDTSDNRKDDQDIKVVNRNIKPDFKDEYFREHIEELETAIKEARKKLDDLNKRTSRNEKERYPSLNDEEMRMLADDPMVVERYPDDTFLQNEHIKLRINNTTGQITHMILADGTEYPYSLQMLYYPGCTGDNTQYSKRSSGAYIFRPNSTKPYELVQNYTKIIKGDVLDEVQYTMADYASGVIRLYKHPKLNYIEHEWLVGPIPIDDDVGKEVVVRYITDVINNGEFYTDSNGRQMLKRKLNQRPQWNLTLNEPIAGNYYPINNKIYIEDSKRIAVLTDRSHGGTSLEEGVIEVMLHRRLLHDDAFGVGEALNETAEGVGLVVRGRHLIVISQANDKDAIIDERKKVLEMHLQPIVFVSDAKDLELADWLTLKNKIGAIKNAPPKGVHILTVEPWDGKTVLLRFENYLEKSDQNDTTLEVDISELFSNITVKSIRETTLSANQWMKDYNQWTWEKENDFSRSFNENCGSFAANNQSVAKDVLVEDNGLKIKLKAKQIRSFVAEYDFIST